ncbi:MAG: M16 family metallopeptidase [Candidatus Bipolaricaulia bacterium]
MAAVAFHTHRFENGITLVGERNPNLNSVAFTILVPTGAATDPEGRKGSAAVLQEYLFRGAGSYNARKLAQKLDKLGVQRGQTVTAELSTFSAGLLGENLVEALRFYATLLIAPTFPEEELEELRQLALQRLKALEDSPQEKLLQELKLRFFPTPLGNPVHGLQADLEALSYEEIRADYKRRYGSEGMIITLAGNFDPKQAEAAIASAFAEFGGKVEELPPLSPQAKQVMHIEKETNQMQIGIAFDSVPFADDAYFQARIGLNALSGGMSSRLFTEVREKRGLAYAVGASHVTTRTFGGVLCYAGTTTERSQETLDVTLAELFRLREGIDWEEFERAKVRLKSSFITQGESSPARSRAIATEWFHTGRVRTVEEMIATVDALTLEQTNEHLVQYGPDAIDQFTIFTMGAKPLEVR